MQNTKAILSVDLNADVAECCGQDDALMPLISSANICCALHAGSPAEMQKTLQLAKANQVCVGAHPSFNDRENFGRKNQVVDADEIRAIMAYQLGAFDAMCKSVGIAWQYVKPHGALYNQAANDEQLATLLVQSIARFNPEVAVMGLSGSLFLRIAQQHGLKTISEVFADRRYEANGTLVARSQANAVIEDDDEAIAQVLQMVQHGTVRSVQGQIVPVQAESICLHGDGIHAIEFAKKIKHHLQQNQIVIQAKYSNEKI